MRKRVRQGDNGGKCIEEEGERGGITKRVLGRKKKGQG